MIFYMGNLGENSKEFKRLGPLSGETPCGGYCLPGYQPGCSWNTPLSLL